MALFTRIQKVNLNQTEDESNFPSEQQDLENESNLQLNYAEENVSQVSQNRAHPKDNDWLDKEKNEGQLSVDVFQTKDEIMIKSTIAGVKPEDIDIAIDNDMVTIRGSRKLEENIKEEDYFYQECYWGDFSRSIILPTEVVAEQAEANLKNGVLTLVLPKARKSKSVAVKVKSE